MIFSDCNPYVRFAGYSKFYHSPRNEAPESQIFKKLYDSRLIYITDGECRLKMAGGGEHSLCKDDLFYMPAGCEFAIVAEMPHASMGLVCFDFTQEYTYADKLILADKPSRFKSRRMMRVPPIEDYPELIKPFVVKKAFTHKKPFADLISSFDFHCLYREDCSGQLKSLLSRILRQLKSGADKTDSRINLVAEYIDSNFSRKITNDDICREVGYHPHYLNTIIKQQTGKTIHTMLAERRISEAQMLLASTDNSVSAIADKCGFLSQTHFSNCFKSFTNMTPRQFRTQNSKIMTDIL